MINAPTSEPPKADWEVKTLGEVCEMIKRGIAPKYSEQEGLCVINQKCVRDHLIDFSLSRRHDFEKKKVPEERIVKIGDVLVNSTGVGTLGRVAQIREETEEAATVDTHVTIVRPIPGKFYLDFFGYMLVMIEEEIKTSGEGASGQTELARKTLSEKFHVKYPNSIAEQERIVGILDEAFEGIAAATDQAEKNLHNARELFQSVLQSTFSPKGDDWVETTLGELGKVSMCKRILKHQTATKGDIPFYKIGTFGKTPNAFISKEIYDEFREKYSFPEKGEILISASGTIGRRVIYDGEPAYFQDSNIVWIANNENLILNSFLYYFYDICEWNPSRGATISRLYNDDLRKIKISFPANREKQLELVDVFKNLEIYCKKLETIYERKQSALAELKQSLLQKAFAGEL